MLSQVAFVQFICSIWRTMAMKLLHMPGHVTFVEVSSSTPRFTTVILSPKRDLDANILPWINPHSFSWKLLLLVIIFQICSCSTHLENTTRLNVATR